MTYGRTTVILAIAALVVAGGCVVGRWGRNPAPPDGGKAVRMTAGMAEGGRVRSRERPVPPGDDEWTDQYVSVLQMADFPEDPEACAEKLEALLVGAMKAKGSNQTFLIYECLDHYLLESFQWGASTAEKADRVKLMMEVLDRLDEARGDHWFRDQSGGEALCDTIVNELRSMGDGDQEEFLDLVSDREKGGLDEATADMVRDLLGAREIYAHHLDLRIMEEIEDSEQRRSVEELLLDTRRLLGGAPEIEKMARYYFSGDSGVPEDGDGPRVPAFFEAAGLIAPVEIERVILDAPSGRKRDRAIMAMIPALPETGRDGLIPDWIGRIGDAELREQARRWWGK